MIATLLAYNAAQLTVLHKYILSVVMCLNWSFLVLCVTCWDIPSKAVSNQKPFLGQHKRSGCVPVAACWSRDT